MTTLCSKIKIEDLQLFKIIGDLADKHSLLVYLVGGYNRDLLIGREKDIKDFDFVVVDPSKQIKKLGLHFANIVIAKLHKIGKTSNIKQQKNFGTCQFVFNGVELEFVGARKESYDRGSRKPIIEDGTLEDDQDRRDFRCNDIYMSLNSKTFGTLIDKFNGQEDIKNKIIQCPNDPNVTFDDDPLRMMRAIRFASVLGFTITFKTKAAIKKHASRIKIISAERITAELNKILKSKLSHVGIQLMADLGLLEIILPEVYNLKGKDWAIGSTGKKIAHKDNLWHTIRVLENWDNSDDWENLWGKWSALLHDIGKLKTKRFDKNGDSGKGKWTFHAHQDESVKLTDKIFRRMKLPLDFELKYVSFVIAKHERIKISSEMVTDSAVRRLIAEVQEALGDDKYLEVLFNFGARDSSSSYPDVRKKRIDTYSKLYKRSLKIKERDNLENFQPPINGDQLMKIFNLKPSKKVGDLKKELKNAILDGRIKNEYKACYDYIVKYAKDKFNLSIIN